MYVDPNRNTEAGNLKWILPYCKPDLPRVAGAIVLFCVNNTMALIIPILSGIIVDRVIVQGHVDELTRLCIMMIVFTIVRVTSRYGYQMWMERFGQNSVFRLVSDEYEKLHELDFTYFNHTRTGDIMSRMTSDTDAIRHALSWVSYQVLDCVVMFVGALAMMFTIDWRLALALACVTPFIFILTRGLSTHARPLFFAIRNSLAEMNSMVEENIEGNRVIKAFVREPYETEKFDERNDDYMQRNMAQAYNSRKYMPWLDGLGFSLQLITLGLGGFLVITGRMTLGDLVAFNSYLWMIDGPVRQSGWLINDWQRFNASCIKIRKLLTSQSHITEKPGVGAKANTATTNANNANNANGANDATGNISQSQATFTTSATQAAQTTQVTTNATRIAGSIDFQHVSFAFPDEPNTPCLKTWTSMFRQAPNSAFSAKRARANPPSSTSSPASTTPPKAMCSSTASTRETGRLPHCARKSASSRKTRSCSPTPLAATSASVWANSANTTNSTFAAWPPSPVRTASSAACRKVTIPWSESVASAFPAAKNSA